MIVDETFATELGRIAILAGREIMSVYEGADVASWSKADQSPLTEADLRADAVIRRELGASFPGVFILSEESVSSGEADRAHFFLVDPLDGTKEFLKRNGEFTVNIAWIEGHRASAGVVYVPARDALYTAAGKARLLARGETRELRVAPRAADEPLRVVGSRSHGADEVVAWLERLGRPYVLTPAGSSLKFCAIAAGDADVYPRFGPTSQWDTAAAQAVLEAAGGAVLDLDGEPLRYGLDRPTLNPHFVALARPGDFAALGLRAPLTRS